MRFNYKVVPLAEPHPAFPNDTSVWMPVMSIKIDNPATHSPPTKRFEVIVDSGAPDCFFHADVGRAIGLKIESGVQGDLGGIVKGANIKVYYHDIGLYVGADRIRVRAGFSDAVSVGGILGRRGFFENFIITFDPSLVPAGFEIQRLGRA